MKKTILILALVVIGVLGVKATQYVNCGQGEWQNCSGGECGWNSPTGPATMTCKSQLVGDKCTCQNV